MARNRAYVAMNHHCY